MIEHDSEILKESELPQEADTLRLHSSGKTGIRVERDRCDRAIRVQDRYLDGDHVVVREVQSADAASVVRWHQQRIKSDGRRERKRKYTVVGS